MDDYVFDMFKRGFLAILCLMIVCWTYMSFIYPNVHVWQESKIGEAELARAESNRQIKTLEAKATCESAKQLAEAEVIRARGVAEANKIIGQSLNENEAYLRYLWINNLQSDNLQVIYVPTEANLPITESRRLNDKNNK